MLNENHKFKQPFIQNIFHSKNGSLTQISQHFAPSKFKFYSEKTKSNPTNVNGVGTNNK